MKKIIILFAIISSFGVVNSYGQIPVTLPPVQEENKVADFKILTPEEAEKINAENQKKAEEAQRLANIAEAKYKKEAERLARKEKNAVKRAIFYSLLGVAVVTIGTLYYVESLY
jgi:hypothetical protein